MDTKTTEKIANLFPEKKMACGSCEHSFTVKRGDIKFSKRLYEGPYCPNCGEKILK